MDREANATLGEQGPFNPSPIRSIRTRFSFCLRFSLVGVSACQADVGGIVTRLGRQSTECGSMVDRQFWELENGGSIPLTPTNTLADGRDRTS